MNVISSLRSLRQRIVGTLCAMALFASGCSTTTEVDPNSQALKEILATKFVTTDGDNTRLSDFEGKMVLVHFMASWCVECAAEAPTLRNLHQAFEGSDLAIVGVVVDDDPFSAKTFVSRHQLPFPVLLDTNGDLKQFFSVKDLPVTIFLDRSGVPIPFQDPQSGLITAKLEGARQWDTTKPVEMIATMIETR